MALTKVTNRLEPPPEKTLADVLATLKQRPDIRADRRRNMISSVTALCRLLGDDPSIVPAAPGKLRQRINAIHWQASGLSQSYIANVKTHTILALRHADIPIMQSRTTAPLSAEWKSLKSRIAEKGTWCHLSRFASFCTDHGINPQDVEPKTFAGFEAALDAYSLKGDPKVRIRAGRWAWRETAIFVPEAGTCPPPTSTKSRRYSLEWEEFPPSFMADVDAFTTARSNPDPFAPDYCNPVADSTTALRRRQIRQLATALVASGFPMSNVTSLAVLTSAENAQAALQHLYQRAGSKPTTGVGQQAQLLQTIAKYWVKAPKATTDHLVMLTANLRKKKPKGMIEKNRDRLRPFNDEKNIDLLVNMPHRVLAELARMAELGANDVARGVYAIAVEILLHAPIRISNLCYLKIGSELQTVGQGASQTMRIVLAKTKNGDPYEVGLATDVVVRLRMFMRVIRPTITSNTSHWLFPNQFGDRRSPIGFSRGLQAFIARETGLVMNSHLFRHLAVLIQRNMDPGDRETPRQLLGHRSNITETAYTRMDTAAAAKRHDVLIAQIRARTTRAASGIMQERK